MSQIQKINVLTYKLIKDISDVHLTCMYVCTCIIISPFFSGELVQYPSSCNIVLIPFIVTPEDIQ